MSGDLLDALVSDLLGRRLHPVPRSVYPVRRAMHPAVRDRQLPHLQRGDLRTMQPVHGGVRGLDRWNRMRILFYR
jgi:hypothetical protein